MSNIINIANYKATDNDNISEKSISWLDFCSEVVDHIEDYVVPQYGDKHEDECAEYSVEDCIKQIKKYATRNGRNSRQAQDQLDLIKIAHYAQMAWDKLEEQKHAH